MELYPPEIERLKVAAIIHSVSQVQV